MGWELADKTGLGHPIRGALAPASLIDELASTSAALLVRAHSVGAIRPEVTPADVAAAI